MTRLRWILPLVGILVSTSAHAQEESPFSPDRPGMATGPGVLTTGQVMWETGFEGQHIDRLWTVTLPTTMARVGISSFAELRLEYDGGLVKERDGWQYEVAPLIFGAKARILKGDRWVPEIALLANISIPCTQTLVDEMRVAPSLNVLFSNDVCDWFNLTYNVGVSWNGINQIPVTFLALCLGFNMGDRFGAFLESYNYLSKEFPGDVTGICNLDGGFTFLAAPRVQLDLYAGLNLQQPQTLAFVGLGVAWQIN